MDEETAAGAALDVAAEVSRHNASEALSQAAEVINKLVSRRAASRAQTLQPEDRHGSHCPAPRLKLFASSHIACQCSAASVHD